MDNMNNDIINDIMLRLCIYDNTPPEPPTTKGGKIAFVIIMGVCIILMVLATLYCTGCFD